MVDLLSIFGQILKWIVFSQPWKNVQSKSKACIGVHPQLQDGPVSGDDRALMPFFCGHQQRDEQTATLWSFRGYQCPIGEGGESALLPDSDLKLFAGHHPTTKRIYIYRYWNYIFMWFMCMNYRSSLGSRLTSDLALRIDLQETGKHWLMDREVTYVKAASRGQGQTPISNQLHETVPTVGTW